MFTTSWRLTVNEQYIRVFRVNPNTNQSNNRGVEPDDLDVSPVFDKMGNRIGIRRATQNTNAISCQPMKKARLDPIFQPKNLIGQVTNQPVDKPIEMISSESVSSGNDTITIQPESPKSDRDEIEEIIPQAENDDTPYGNDFYMPSKSNISYTV